MHRNGFMGALSLIALGVLLVTPAWAGDTGDLQTQVDRLEKQVEALSAQQQTLLEQEIEKYLDENATWTAAQGKEKGLEGVSISGRFTGVSQNLVGNAEESGGNASVVSGDVDLDFWMQVTENLGLFIYTTANASSLDIDGEFLDGIGFGGGYPNFPWTFPNGDVTAAGHDDGIGVDGTVPVKPGSIRIYEAGIQHSVPIGQSKLHWEVGNLDPRRRFLQTQFADDENTQFIHNLFDDPSSIGWMSNAAGLTVFGIHTWIVFGANENWTVNLGYFNLPGTFWDHGQLGAQVSWKGEVGGREMNARAMWLYDNFYSNLSGEKADSQWGFAWDWLATDQLGVFARVTGNSKDVMVVKNDFSLGAQYKGIGQRENDVAGVAFGWQSLNENVTGITPKDSELVLEIYYLFALEDGKLQITPHLIYIKDPMGQDWGNGESSLWILGIRIFVPF